MDEPAPPTPTPSSPEGSTPAPAAEPTASTATATAAPEPAAASPEPASPAPPAQGELPSDLVGAALVPAAASPSAGGTPAVAPVTVLGGSAPVTPPAAAPVTILGGGAAPVTVLGGGAAPPAAPLTVLGGGAAPAAAPVTVLGGGAAPAAAPVTVLGGGAAPAAAPVTVLGGGPPAAGGTSRIVATPQGPRVVGPGVRAPGTPAPPPTGVVARPQPAPAAGPQPGPAPRPAGSPPAAQAATAAAESAAQVALAAAQAAQAAAQAIQAAQAAQAVQAAQAAAQAQEPRRDSKSSDRLRPAGPRTQRRLREPGQGLPIVPLAIGGLLFGGLVALAIVQTNKPRPTAPQPPAPQTVAPPPAPAPAAAAGGGVLADDPIPDLRRGREGRGFEQWLALAHEEAARGWKILAAGRAAAAKSRLEESRKRFFAANAPTAALAILDDANLAMGGAPPPDKVPPHFSTEGLGRPSTSAPPPPPSTSTDDHEVVATPAPATETPRRPMPTRPTDPGRGTSTSTEVTAPTRPEGPDDGEYASEGSARALLFELYERTWSKDPAGAKKAYEALLAGDGESVEVQAARGFVLSQEGKYSAALSILKPLGSRAGAQAVRDRAFAALYLGQLDEVRVLLDDPALAGSSFRAVVEGPFKQDYPHAARVLEEMTDDGHYRVVSDLGLTTAELTQLEARLAAVDGTARTELEIKLRRQHRGLQELLDTMTKAYKAYDKLFGIDRPGEVVPTVFVFSDRQPFDAFSRALGVGSTENTLGYYWPPYRILVFYDQEEGRRRGWLLSKGTLETLLHETFHQWLDIYVADAPRWFDEGLAEYFGISELTKTELRYGLVPDRHPSRLDNIRSAFMGELPKPLPLDRLLTTEHEQFMSPRQAAVNYAHAWSFAHFLGSNPGGQRILRDYFQALRAGKSITAAYQQVFGKLDIKVVEAEWREYVGKLR